MDYSLRLSVLLLFIGALAIFSGCAPVPGPSAATDDGDFAGGRALFESKGCPGCHLIERPSVEQTISERLVTLGPVLWYSGAKFKDGFLKGWLREPTVIRPMEYNSLTSRSMDLHPGLAPGAAEIVAAFLMSLGPSHPDAPVALQRSGEDLGSLGRRLFNYKGACYGCHRTRTPRGLVVGGLSGPSLLRAGERLRAEWIYAYLSKPDAYPVRAMPNYAGIMTDAELRALSGYVAGFE